MMNMMQSNVIRVTKHMAGTFLGMNVDNNRKINRQRVMAYAKSMDDGNWIPGTSIIIDINGKMIDGQHRLLALLESSLEHLDFIVVTGVSPNFILEADRGQPRTVSQNLRISGKNYDNIAIGAVSILQQWESDPNIARSSRINIPPVSHVLERLEFLEPSISHVLKRLSASTFLRNSSVLASLTLGHKVSEEKLDNMISGLVSGEHLSGGMPAFAFREKVIRSRGISKKRLEVLDYFSTLCGLVEAEINKRPVFRPKVNDSAVVLLLKRSGYSAWLNP